MDMAKNQHVIPHKGGWAVKIFDKKKPSRKFNTKKEAIKHATVLSKKQNVCMIVHDIKGNFESFDCG